MKNMEFEKWIKDNGWHKGGRWGKHPVVYLGGGDSAVATRKELWNHWRKEVKAGKWLIFHSNKNHWLPENMY